MKSSIVFIAVIALLIALLVHFDSKNNEGQGDLASQIAASYGKSSMYRNIHNAR